MISPLSYTKYNESMEGGEGRVDLLDQMMNYFRYEQKNEH